MTTKVKVVFIGDPHFQVTNIPEVEQFTTRLLELVDEENPDLLVVGGDLLHTHERLHTIPLNKAHEFVDHLRKRAPTYVLVGNHDMCNNQQFLTTNHWMNSMKEWANVTIVDRVHHLDIAGCSFVFVPYVPPGRFVEALDTFPPWQSATCIFAHQEFAGCKMGAIVSTEGDAWPLTHPHVISGHIHANQKPQDNVYYTGSAMQHAFGESERNIIACLTFCADHPRSYACNEVDLRLPRKKIVYVDVDNIDSLQLAETEDKVKLSVCGNYEEFKALKKTKKYRDLIDQGLNIVFKPKKLAKNVNSTPDSNAGQATDGGNLDPAASAAASHDNDGPSFSDILLESVLKENNRYLSQAYEIVVNDRKLA